MANEDLQQCQIKAAKGFAKFTLTTTFVQKSQSVLNSTSCHRITRLHE